MSDNYNTSKYEELKSALGGCENLHTVFFDSSPDSIIVLDKNFTIIHSNLNVAVLFHKTPEDLKGKDITEFLTEESKIEFINYYKTQSPDIFTGRRQILRLGEWTIDIETKETPHI